MKEAMTARKEGKIVLVAQMNKNKKFQKEQLGKEGYSEFKEFYKEDREKDSFISVEKTPTSFKW